MICVCILRCRKSHFSKCFSCNATCLLSVSFSVIAFRQFIAHCVYLRLRLVQNALSTKMRWFSLPLKNYTCPNGSDDAFCGHFLLCIFRCLLLWNICTVAHTFWAYSCKCLNRQSYWWTAWGLCASMTVCAMCITKCAIFYVRISIIENKPAQR